MSQKMQAEKLYAIFQQICKKLDNYALRCYDWAGGNYRCKQDKEAEAKKLSGAIKAAFIAIMKKYEKLNADLRINQSRDIQSLSNRIMDELLILANTEGIPYFLQKLNTAHTGFLPLAPEINENFKKLIKKL